ncbi:MAG: D-alanyl-D-alanine carboxypeptidase family protein, partial [Kiritimatiellia bacterium]
AIKSANDAAYLISEYFGGGDVASFVARMNERAKELGFSGTRFVNAHGLTDSASGENSVSTPEEMVLLGERLLEYPKLMEWFGTPMDHFTYPTSGKTIELANHNKLVRPRYPGVDGIKTGYNAQSGFCLTVSCLRNGRRLMACVMGFPSAKDLKTGRDPFARKLLDWGYSRAAELDHTAAAPTPNPAAPTSQSPTRNLRR